VSSAQAQTALPAAQENKQLPASSAPRAADHQTSPPFQEFAVTATHRPERPQDVPLSVSAFSQENLAANGIAGYGGLVPDTPRVVHNERSVNFNMEVMT
jgi:iron complex outermembrane recepter protein